MTKTTFVSAFAYLSIISGFVSAWLWYRASTATVRQGDPEARNRGLMIGDVDLYATLLKSSRINKWAAAATGVAVLLQALSSAIEKASLAAFN